MFVVFLTIFVLTTKINFHDNFVGPLRYRKNCKSVSIYLNFSKMYKKSVYISRLKQFLAEYCIKFSVVLEKFLLSRTKYRNCLNTDRFCLDCLTDFP